MNIIPQWGIGVCNVSVRATIAFWHTGYERPQRRGQNKTKKKGRKARLLLFLDTQKCVSSLRYYARNTVVIHRHVCQNGILVLLVFLTTTMYYHVYI